MARYGLDRVLRGAHRRAIDEIATLLPAPIRVEDARGKVLYGEASEGASHPIVSGGEPLGVVVGGEGAATVARVIAFLHEREVEKRALADETLGRYKELTLLYELSDKLSRVLDVDEVARMVVAEAQQFLHASGAAILLHDRRREVLVPIATAGDEPRTATTPASRGLCGRVLESGRAEFVEDASVTDLAGGADDAEPSGAANGARGRALMCAPLRTGESVFGLLRVSNERPAAWTAGDLKLVTALAAHAASAISHGMLHRDQLRQQALRSQIERFVSPRLVEVALAGQAGDARDPVPVLFCDLGRVTAALGADVAPADVLETLVAARSLAVDVLMQHGATVNAAQGEMLVGLFPHDGRFVEAAKAAADAATGIVRALATELRLPPERGPGVGVARTWRCDPDDPSDYFAGVGVAASLQAAGEGRILVEAEIADAIADARPCVPLTAIDLPRGRTKVYEVRP